jgi:3-isopropylmalate/(R)-2-methylmalate dehydratase large subunit
MTAMTPPPSTLIDKIWNDHLVADLGDDLFLVRIDRILLHERGGGLALRSLSEAGRGVRHPETVFATLDHVVDTRPGRTDATLIPHGTDFIRALRRGVREHGLRLFDIHDAQQGIVHVISPELGIALPGATLVCNDSHTGTLGGVGALAWGIGSSELEHVLATQTLVLHRPKTMRVTLDGTRPAWVTAKDLVLHLIGVVGAGGGNGFTVELAGNAVRHMTVDERLTLCNMLVELGARSGLIAPDDTTFESLERAAFSPRGRLWQDAVDYWRTLASDPEARFGKEVVVDCRALAPQVTWGTSPEQVIAVDACVPASGSAYMGLAAGTPLEGLPIDAAFIGSCTNGRLSDLRAAAQVLRGRKVHAGIRALCVPGSSQVKRSAEAEGLDRVFRDAGFEWRESGCSLCFDGGGEGFGPGQRVVTTTNRNFEGRQGPATRSHLASPATVAASAVAGCIADVRKLEARP